MTLTPLERTETALGCVVETRRQVNAHGVEIEHISLSTMFHVKTETDEGDTDVRSPEV